METKIAPQILVAYDFSDCSELALEHAMILGEEDSRRQFHFLVVLDRNKGLGLKKNEKIDYVYAEEVQKLATSKIEAMIKDKGMGGSFQLVVHVRLGSPAEQILALADEIGASLILVGSHGRSGVARLVMGSVSENIVRRALCPVLVARPRTYEDVQRAAISDTPEGEHGPAYIPPHRFHYDTGIPPRDKAWVLY